MILRPRLDLGDLEELELRTDIAKKSTDATLEDFEQIASSMGLMMGLECDHLLELGNGHGKAAMRAKSIEDSSKGSSSGQKAPEEIVVTVLNPSSNMAVNLSVKERLNKKRIALEKANKASERIAEAAFRVVHKSPRFVAAIEGCSLLQEKAMTLEAQLGFLIKFKKTMHGEAMTDEIGEDYISQATVVINEMYEEAKVIKTLTTSGKKPATA